MTREKAPLVVIGGGPVGLAAALAFAARGVPVVVLESGEDEVRAEWRGSTLHPPTLEFLDTIGVAKGALSDGVRVYRLQYRDLELEQVVEFRYRVLDGLTRYPFRTQYEQYKLLRELRDAAAKHPAVDLRFGQRVTGLEPDVGKSHVVVAALDRSGAGHEIEATWLVGADGAHSVVRQSAGIAFAGDTYPTLSLVAATNFELADAIADLGPVSYWSGPDGRVSLIRTPDTWRVAVSTDLPSARHGSATSPVPNPRLVEALDRLVGDRRWAEVPLGQHQLYRSHQRVASEFRRDRVLLIGDAAHLASTTGGMGLNSGLHDAFDLAGRLAEPLRAGDAESAERAAATYADVRREATLRIVQPATRATRTAVDATDRDTRLTRLNRLRRMAADPAAAAHHLREVSMLDAVEVLR